MAPVGRDGGSEGVDGGLGGSHLLVEVGLLHGLFAPLQGGAVLVLQGLQVCHGLHALQLQTLVVVTCFGVWPDWDKKVEKQDDLLIYLFLFCFKEATCGEDQKRHLAKFVLRRTQSERRGH